jgi:dihydroorotate dehydrogenase (NAD+) catalytic subunit
MNAQFQDLGLLSPWLNAAGTLGFSPGANAWPWPEPAGGFVTNPVSLRPRHAAEGRACIPYAGGFLLHTGLPNPGLGNVLRLHADRWDRSRIPVWVYLLSNDPQELHQMMRTLEEVEGVAAIEVGIPPFAGPQQAFQLVDAAAGEKPVIINFPLTILSEAWLEELPEHGAFAISLGPPRGTLLDSHGRLVSGRIYGPALMPLLFRAISVAKRSGIPVIAGCGVHSLQDGNRLLTAGAAAVMLDSVLWR